MKKQLQKSIHVIVAMLAVALMFNCLSLVDVCCFAKDVPTTLADKTFVAWVSPANLTQRGGSAMTVTVNSTRGDHFDGIVLGELEPAVWMAGSNGFKRTDKNQANWPKETLSNDTFVQIAIVYKGKQVTIYRDGKRYVNYTVSEPSRYEENNVSIMLGPRHPGSNDFFQGCIKDARIYNVALDPETIAAMQPSKEVQGVAPWAWWDFANTGLFDKAQRFNQVRLSGGAKIENGALVLTGEKPTMLASAGKISTVTAPIPPGKWDKNGEVPESVINSARQLREKFLEDPYRPGYHFCVPEGRGLPGDPNGCFFANGRYHLMYLYKRVPSGYCWGHLSSKDLVHWRNHPDAIGPGNGDEGCYSGGGFVDDDGKAYLSYWMLWGDKGIGLAKSSDRHYSSWQKFPENPVIKSTEFGITETTDADGKKLIYGSADPSNIWKKDGKYYMCTGSLPVLNKYGRKPDSPEEMRGDRLYLFESHDLKDWKYKGVFYQRNPEWTEDSEDNMCPSFLPLSTSPDGGIPSQKHLLLFISHNKGCQYYIGDYDAANDRLIPNNHGRMSWIDNTYFAPEALVDDKGRQIMWAWILDNPPNENARGWSGVYGLPRSLWLGEDGTLRMRPVKELETLRYHEQTWNNLTLEGNQTKTLDGIVGNSCELEFTIDPSSTAKQYGIKVAVDADQKEQTTLYYNAEAKQLVFDATQSGPIGRKNIERAPLELKEGEPLRLRVFVDKSIIEIYANDRQAICRRVYPSKANQHAIVLFTKGGQAKYTSIKAWEMMPSNPY